MSSRMSMEIKLGFKAFDPHELLCHFVAHKAGLYRQENLAVELADITFSSDDGLPQDLIQASCGAALAAALAAALKGAPQRVVVVAVDKPMFWIYGADHVSRMSELADGRIATYPPVAPPHHMANVILQKAGVDVNRLRSLPARDDVARLGLLRSASVDAAVISSSISPIKIKASGLKILAFFGDELRVPTTGLAINEAYIAAEPALSATLAEIWRGSLARIHSDPEIISSVLEEIFDVPSDIRQSTAELYQNYYTLNGQTTAEIAQGAIASMSVAMDIASPPAWDSIYVPI